MLEEANPPLISVVIPTRWRASLVLRAIRSALDQTYPSVEVIVVVDGADANTLEALEALNEPRLRVVANRENVGGSEARNIGIREARGSWIAMLDDDDEWFPDKLEKQMATVTDLSARYTLVTSRRWQRQQGHADVLAPARMPRPGEDISEYMFYSEDKQRHMCGPQTSSYLATRRLFLDVPFTKGLKCHQDWDWYLRAMRNRGTYAYMVEDPLYIMYVETSRPRVTDLARWELSLGWVESRRSLFTPRAYNSFLIHECMFRCEERHHRLRIFRKLLTLCQRNGRLQWRDMAAALKWYLFPPSARMLLVRLFKRMPLHSAGPHPSAAFKMQ